MTPKTTLLLTFAVLVVLIVLACLFTVTEGQSALVSRLGKLQTDEQGNVVSMEPGLHAKLPLVDKALVFDVRLQTLELPTFRVMTEEKKEVIVDYYVKWRINNLPRYYTSTGGQTQRTEELLQQQVNEGLRAEFGRRSIKDVVSDERENIMKALNVKANQSAQELGVDVVDVRIKGIDLPEEVSNAVFERMRAERERVAQEHRSEGKAKAEAIQAQADAQATVIVAKALEAGNQLRAKGDQKAARIYADTYGKDPEFYTFYRSLLAYDSIFNSKANLLLLSPESDFFKYFNNIEGTQQQPSAP